MSSIRVYLKHCLNEVDAKLVKLDMDEYGWYYQSRESLELFVLPPAITPDNITFISVVILVVHQGENRMEKTFVYGGERYQPYGEYRHGDTTGFYGEYGRWGQVRIRTNSLEDAKVFWHLMRAGRLQPYTIPESAPVEPAVAQHAPVEPAVPQHAPEGNRIIRALRVLCGQA